MVIIINMVILFIIVLAENKQDRLGTRVTLPM